MGQKAIIEHGDGYKVVLEGKGLSLFFKASQQPAIQPLQGEELVRALVTLAQGKISEVLRFKSGVAHDGPNGEFAIEEYNDRGVLTAAHHKINGKPAHNDGKPGSLYFTDWGSLRNQSYYDQAGKLVRSTDMTEDGAVLLDKEFTAEGGAKIVADNRPVSTRAGEFNPHVRKAAEIQQAPAQSVREIQLETIKANLPALKII